MAEEERKPMPLLKRPTSIISLENGFENIHIKNDPLDITDHNSMEESYVNNSDDNEEEIQPSLQHPDSSENTSTPVQKYVGVPASLDVDVDIDLGVDNSSNIAQNQTITPVINNNFNTSQNSQSPSDLNYFIEYNKTGDSMSQNSNSTLEDSLLLTDNTFSCSFCSFTTDKQKVLVDHERNHRKTNLPIFQCFYCSQKYTKHMLYLHVQSVHPGQKFQIRDKDGLSFSCFKCLFQSDKEEDLNEHMKTHFSEPSSEKTSDSNEEKSSDTPTSNVDTAKPVLYSCMVQCELCSYVCYARDIKYHMNSHRKKLPIIKCSRCPFRSTATALKYHMKNCRKTHKSSKESRPKAIAKTFKCSVCVFTTTNKAKLDIHAKIHVPRPPKAIAKTFKCSVCNFTTTEKAKLDIHTKIHVPVDSNDETPFRCFKCSFATLDEDRMWEHMQTHINAAKKAAVELEAKNNSNKPSANNKDASADVFECPKCTFSTDSQYKLNTHLKSHSSASEPTKKTVKQSRNVHAKNDLYEPNRIQSSDGGYSYRCKMCSYERRNNSNLESHMNSHRLNQPIRKCPNCDFKSTRTALGFHRTKCQGESSETTEPSSSSLAEENESPNDEEDVSESETNSEGEMEAWKSTGATGVTYHCNFCSYETYKTTNMRTHLRSHKKNLTIEKCSKCPYRSTAGALRYHSLNCKSVPLPRNTNKVPSKGIFKCSECPFKTTMRLKYKVHQKNHKVFPVQSFTSGEHLYHCNKCSYASTKHTAVKAHMNLHKLNLPVEKCPNCEFRSTKHAMTFHLIKCNAKSKVMESDCASSVDDATESTESSVEDSQDDEVQGNTEGYRSCVVLGRKVYKCETCSYFNKKTTSIRRHIKTHELKLPIIDCPKCDFRSTGRAVKFHLKTCTATSKVTTDDSNLPFTCTSCSFSTTLRIKLKAHVRKFHSVVSKIKLFSCKSCSFVTKKRNVYQKHLQGHPLNLPIKVSEAEDQTSSTGDDKTSETGNISKKTETTTSEDSLIKWKQGFKCGSCSYTSLLKGSMIRHINGHKKYNWPIIKCRGCDYRSINLNVLRHEKKCKKSGGYKRKKVVDPSHDLDYRTCPYCSRNIRKPCFANYRVHLDEQHCDKILKQDVFRVFRCADCKFATVLYSKLGQHQNETGHKILDDAGAKTDECDSDKSKLEETNKSDLKVSNKTINKCKFCSFTSTITSCLSMHLKLHTEWKQPIKKCKTCEYRSTHHSLVLHQKTCSRRVFVKKRSVALTGSELKCPFCLLTFSHGGNLKKHVDTVHGDELTDQDRFDVFRCSQCDFVTIYHEKLRHHAEEANHHLIDEVDNCSKNDSEGESEVPKEKVRFDCEHCDFSTHLNVKLKVHVKKRHLELAEKKGTTNDTTYQCSFCSYATESSVSYKQHMDNTHFDKVTEQDECQVYTCLDCDFASVFISKSVRHREDTNHTLSNVPNKVRKLPPGIPRKKRLPNAQWHKAIKCPYCSYSCKFSDRHNLKRHILTHTVKHKPILQCKTCDYKSTADVLVRHQKTCTGTRSEENDKVEKYDCKFCSYTTHASSIFKRHLDVMHNERLSEQDTFKVFGCLNCSFLTVYYKKMMTHRDNTKHNFVSGVKTKSTNRAKVSKTGCSKKRVGVNEINVSSDEEKNKKPDTEKEKLLFRCTECTFTTYLRIQLNLHVKKYHKHLVRPKVGKNKCKYCSYTTNQVGNLARHMINHDKQKPIEKCANCNFKSTIRALKKHELICDGTQRKEITSDLKLPKKIRISPNKAVRPSSDGAYRCTFCKFNSFHHSAYKIHMENMHIDKIKEQNAFEVYKCLKCEFGTIYNSKMLRHKAQTNHEYEKLENCSKALPSQKKNYSEKARDNSSDEETSDRSYSGKADTFICTTCPFITGYKGNLKRHMDTHAESNKDSNSTKTTTEKSVPKKDDKLKPEQQNKKIISKTEEVFMSSPGTYFCQHCSYTTENRSNLVHHLETHDKWNLPVEQCPNCEYRSTPRALQCHASRCPGKPKTSPITDAEIYRCNLCSYTSTVKSALKAHRDRSHSVKQLPVKQCANCDFTGTRSVLENHGPKCPNRTDVKKVLTCPQCPYTTVMPKKLLTHQEQKHPKEKEVVKPGGPKIFKCEYCSFTSFWQYLIEKHMNSHTLLKLPIESCERCDFRSTPSALAAHMKVCNGKKRDRLSSESSSRGSCSSNDVNTDLNDPPVKKVRLDSPKSDVGLSDLQESGIASNSPSIDERESVVENNLSDTSSIGKNSINSTSTSNVSITSSGSNQKYAFTCPDCTFSTNLRIKLNVHIQKNH